MDLQFKQTQLDTSFNVRGSIDSTRSVVISPTLQPIVTLYRTLTSKLYTSGFLWKKNDVNVDGKLFANRTWTHWYVELVGPALVFYNAQGINPSTENIPLVKRAVPNYINIVDAVVTHEKVVDGRKHVLALNTAGLNRFALQADTDEAVKGWIRALWCAYFDQLCVSDLYTGVSIKGYTGTLMDGHTVEAKIPGDKMFHACRVRMMEGIGGARIVFESQGKVVTMFGVFGAYAVFPDNSKLLESSTLFKLEGEIMVDQEDPVSGFVLLKALSQADMFSWLAGLHVAFGIVCLETMSLELRMQDVEHVDVGWSWSRTKAEYLKVMQHLSRGKRAAKKQLSSDEDSDDEDSEGVAATTYVLPKLHLSEPTSVVVDLPSAMKRSTKQQLSSDEDSDDDATPKATASKPLPAPKKQLESDSSDESYHQKPTQSKRKVQVASDSETSEEEEKMADLSLEFDSFDGFDTDMPMFLQDEHAYLPYDRTVGNTLLHRAHDYDAQNVHDPNSQLRMAPMTLLATQELVRQQQHQSMYQRNGPLIELEHKAVMPKAGLVAAIDQREQSRLANRHNNAGYGRVDFGVEKERRMMEHRETIYQEEQWRRSQMLNFPPPNAYGARPMDTVPRAVSPGPRSPAVLKPSSTNTSKRGAESDPSSSDSDSSSSESDSDDSIDKDLKSTPFLSLASLMNRTQTVDKVTEDIQQSFEAFVDNRLEMKPYSFLSSNQVYEAYRDYCTTQGDRECASKPLLEELMLDNGFLKKQRKIKGKAVSAEEEWYNLAFVE